MIQGNFLYASGQFTTYNGQPALYVAKINKNTGALDTTFNLATGFSEVVNQIASDGTGLFACGDYLTYRGQPANNISRISLSDGTLDTVFTQATGLNLYCNSVIYAHSAVYIAGLFSTYRGGGNPAQRIAKLNPTNGNLDLTFTLATGLNDEAFSVLSDGTSLFVSGSFATYRGTASSYLAKLDPNSGNLDLGFT